MRFVCGVILLPFLVLTACEAKETAPDSATEPLLAFDTTTLRIASDSDTAVLQVEVASTDEQRSLGLMERVSLPLNAGMIFLYEQTQPDSAAFWMFRTHIPLDIAFVDSTGTIQAIQSMEPCESPVPRWCPSYPAGVPYRAALEVNRGYFARHRFRVGDRVLLEDLRLPANPSLY